MYSGKGPLPADQTAIDELQQVAQHQWSIQKELHLTLTTRPTIGQLELRAGKEVLKCWKFSAGITPEVERLKDCFETQCEHFDFNEGLLIPALDLLIPLSNRATSAILSPSPCPCLLSTHASAACDRSAGGSAAGLTGACMWGCG